ncbi:MAG TPA: right-handed parallel beta-helix repeat-containing protein [Acidimicrobiales bacterium]|nr:right-handed parallel beta-helix repeat-containing protein [Acidimicrobiales bacterium]
MNNRVRKVGALLAGVAAFTLPTIYGAQAQVTPVCGQTITQSTTLTADLGPCPNYGLIIGADGIVLDLGGHRIFGTANFNDQAGVYMLGRTGVRVQNGTISDFDAGVVIEGGSRNTVASITAIRNIGRQSGGISTRFGEGIAIESSNYNQILDNRVEDNGPFAGIGVYSLVDSDHPRTTSGPSTNNVIASNDVLNNVVGRDGFTGATDNDGIRIENTYAGTAFVMASNQILDNTVNGNGLDGIAIFARSPGNVIRGNTSNNNGLFRSAARRGDGIIVFNFSDRTTIQNNFTSGNGDNGIRIRGPLGANAGSLNNVIQGNTSVGNAVRPTIPSAAFGNAAYDLHDQNPNCDNNQWFGNRYRTAFPPCTTTGGQQI